MVKLVAQHEAAQSSGSGQAPPRRRLQRRDTSEAAERAMEEHFKGASVMVKYNIKRDGHTLKETIKRDKRAAKAGKKRLSSSYWLGLQSKFCAEAEAVAVADSSEEVDERLVAALKVAVSPNTTTRSRGPLRAWLREAQLADVNQKTMVGLARHLKTYNPAASPSSLAVCLDYMRMVARLKATPGWKYDAEVAQVAEVMDDTLCASWAQLRRERITVSKWCELHLDVAGLVVDPKDMAAVLEHEGEWTQLADQLSRLTSLSRIGQRLFGSMTVHVVASKLRQRTDAELGKLPKRELTEADVASARAAIRVLAKDLQADKYLCERRTISLCYRGMTLEVMANSWEDEVALRVGNHLKSGGAGGKIPALRFEGAIFPRQPGEALKMTDCVAKEYKAARETWNAITTDEDGGDQIVALMLAKQGLLSGMDRTWAIEVALSRAIVGAGGLAMLQARTLAALPEEKALRSLALSGQLLEQLVDSGLFKATSQANRMQVVAVKEVVAKMARGGAPEVTHLQGDFMQQVLLRLKYFCVAKVEGTKTVQPKVLHGLDALAHKLKKVRELKALGQLKFDDLEELHVFGWLLSDESKAIVTGLTNDLLKSVTTVAKKRKERATAGSSTDKPKAKAVAETAHDDDGIMALFA